MSFGAFAHKMLALFGIVAVLLILFVLAYSGSLGPKADSSVHSALSACLTFYRAYAELLDFLVRALGLVVTAFISVLTFVKAWHYAEFNLPRRLAELIRRSFSEHQELRIALVRANTSPDFDTLLLPPPSQAGWYRWLANGVPFSKKTTTDLLRIDLPKLDNEIEVLEEQIKHYKFSKASAHLVNGIDFVRGAVGDTGNVRGSPESLKSFNEALEARPDDLDALELSAKQLRLLNGTSTEIMKLLNRLHDAAKAQMKPIHQARAIRYMAHLQSEQTKDAALVEARQRLDVAKGILTLVVAEDTRPREGELARNRELYARIQMRREKFKSAADELDEAERLYKLLPETEKAAGLQRVKEIRAELEEALKDGDSPGD
jgi:hypothetical protein